MLERFKKGGPSALFIGEAFDLAGISIDCAVHHEECSSGCQYLDSTAMKCDEKEILHPLRQSHSHDLQPIQRILRRKNVPPIKHIHQHHIRLPPINPFTQIRLRADTSLPRRRIRREIGFIVRHQDRLAQQVVFFVEVVVDQVHFAVGGAIRRAVEGALVEGGVRGVVGGLEEVGELIWRGCWVSRVLAGEGRCVLPRM